MTLSKHVSRSDLFETLILAIFGQILAMKPPIFAKFFTFSLKKKKIVETLEGFKKTVKKIKGFQKNCIFRHLRKKIRFWNVKFYISKWDFLSQISKNTVFLKPPLKTKLYYNTTFLVTKNRDYFVKKKCFGLKVSVMFTSTFLKNIHLDTILIENVQIWCFSSGVSSQNGLM